MTYLNTLLFVLYFLSTKTVKPHKPVAIAGSTAIKAEQYEKVVGVCFTTN